MNSLRKSYDGIKNMVTNVIAFVAGTHDIDSSLSSGEVVECDSDCSICENQSISMNSSNRKESVDQLINELQAPAEMQSASKRRKQNSSNSSGGEINEGEEIELIKPGKLMNESGKTSNIYILMIIPF